MNLFRITNHRELSAYIRESLSYSCLAPEVKARWCDHAIPAWYLPLLRDGYTSIPFFAVLDMGGRMVRQRHAFSYSGETAPDLHLFRQYTRALDTLLRDVVIRDIIEDITLHRQDQGIVALLKRLLLPVQTGTSALVTMADSAIGQLLSARMDEASVSGRTYHGVFEGFIEAFARMMSEKGIHSETETTSILSDLDRQWVQSVALQAHALSYPDLELMDRCAYMEDLPPLAAHEQERVNRTLQMIRLEQPMTRSVTPEGGYVGIRNNGGIEEVTSPVMSEWANPAPVLWEKLTNRSLLVYERASRTVPVRRMLLHLVLLNHARLQQIHPASGRVPLREIKYMMASVVRDLAFYFIHLKSVEIHLNLQVASGADSGMNVHSVNLTGISPERVRNHRHFLLDERDIFPWFFSENLVGTSFLSPRPGAQEDFLDLTEEIVPERDILFGDHSSGYENVHSMIFCTTDGYASARHPVAEHVRTQLDLGPTSLDSLVFIHLDEDLSSLSPWQIDPVHQYHRETDPVSGITDARESITGRPLTDIQARDAIRRFFLSRLLGARFRGARI